MKAKTYLMQVKKLDRMIQNKRIEMEQWRNIAESTTAHSDCERVQSSGSKQKMADATINILEIEEEISLCISSLIQIRKAVIRTIEKLPSDEYDLLHKVYIGRIEKDVSGKKVNVYWRLDEVAAEYEKSKSWATTVHGNALKHVQDMLNESEGR